MSDLLQTDAALYAEHRRTFETREDPLGADAAIADATEAARPKHAPTAVQIEAGAKALMESEAGARLTPATARETAAAVWRAMKSANE